jgi:hypothetical protein
MKVSNYITILALLVLGSCTSSLYTGVENDDLYYLPSDQPAATVRTPVKKQIAEGTLKSEEYYDNIYAADTLVSDEYSDAVDYDDAIISNAKDVDIYNYYDNYSYAGRLNRFYGNYFNPYWRDPFYSGWGYPSMSFRFGGYPYYSSFNNPFYNDPFYYDPFYSSYYGGYYGGYYGNYYGYGYSPYSSYYYSPYSNWGYSSYIRDYNNSVTYGRRERQSTSSTKWNSSVSPTSASSRRDGYVSRGDGRRTVSTAVNKDAINASDVKSSQNAVRQATPSVNSRAAIRSSSPVARPEYNNVNRTYTPSYSNPRLSTRPSYNNSRVNSNTGSSSRSAYPETSRSSSNRSSSSSYSSGQSRSSGSYSSPGSYSMPSRRSVSSGSGYSSGSSGGYSNSRSSSSYSGGGGSYSGGGYSSGSSGSSSGSTHSSSGGSSSGGRR